MKLFRYQFFYFFIGLLLLNFNVFAQQNKLAFKHYSTNDGLSQNTVFSIIQDRQGFLWVGTEDGLNKFDGYDFTIYKHENNNEYSLNSSKINVLLEDKFGTIWVGTANGLNFYDKSKNRFVRVPVVGGKSGELDYFVTSLLEDFKGNFWIGTLGGFKLYDRTSKRLTNFYSNNIQNPADLNKVRTIFEDTAHHLWISIGNDLRLFDPVKKTYLSLPPAIEANLQLRNGSVKVIKQDKSGNYYFGTDGEGLFRYNVNNQQFINYRYDPLQKNSIAGNVIRDLFFKSDQELWIGTRDGLSVLQTNTQTVTNYQYNKYDDNSLSHNSIRHIMSDNAGNFWLGTFSGGLNMYSPQNVNFTTISEQLADNPGLNFPVVGAVIATNDGKIWVGTEGGGLNFIDRKAGIYKKINIAGGKHNIIKSLFKDGENTIWIGTYDGLVALNIATGATKEINLVRISKTANRQIFAITRNEKGLWVGTDGQGLVLLDKNGGSTNYVKQKGKLSGNTIFSLLSTANNELWIGTENGLNFLSNAGDFRHFEYDGNNPFSINNNAVNAIFRDSKNRLWLGTKGGGLNILDQKTNKFYSISAKNGLSNDFIHAITEDKAGNIWVSTNRGLSEVALQNFAFPLSPKMYSVKNYAISDGLQGNQFSANAVAVTKNGEIIFGGINGLTTFFPSKIIKNTYKPKVVLTELLIKNKIVNQLTEDSPLTETIGETKKITLSSDQAFFSLKFASLNFINPSKNSYAYKLEGFEDDDWHYVDNQRIATYTNLNAGKYVFKVKSANNDGVWNETPTTLEIVVLPPWFESWWAYLAYAIVIVGLLYLYYSYSLKTASLKNELVLESRIRENDLDLYQRKLNFFTNISHEIKTPLTLILSPLEKLLDSNTGNNRMQNQLMLMKRNGEHLVRLINQLLDFRKFESGKMLLQASEGNIVRFVREVAFAFDSYATHLKIKLTAKSTQKSVRLWFDRDKFEKITYNLLSNALKFTKPGGAITIYIEEDKLDSNVGFVSIIVEDNGLGIPKENIDKIFDQFSHYDKDGYNRYGSGIGLTFTKALVELHHGSITAESTEENGSGAGLTRFTIKVPLGKNHLREDEIIADYKDSENIEAYQLADDAPISSALLDATREEVISARNGEVPILLIVEDNHEVMRFLTSHFEDRFSVLTAVNGKEGIEKAILSLPDIIISDVMMPEVSGTILCSTLKRDNRTSHIPIILLTARTPLVYKIEGLETGADDYITKPFSIKVVEARVWNLLASRQQLRERYKREVTLQPTNMAITLPDELFLDKVMAYIENNMAEPTLSVEELGKEVFMSRVTLYRKIKALTNQTTIEFIRSVRLKKAHQYLETGNYSVSEVGYMVGFSDTDYFRKCFKEQYNKTPKEISKKNKSGE
ncbi:response regulator [Pedobacter changchengzhani]|uniref:histidine kinase n=1 Tax=Pedobacter changchengzhani TaxID=2529274 RepID=A0A4R5MK57_9SPHI|nr:two-component regulator propeller domain-containing protein [Pedobacter changchengzhani]TDG36011.1 response regulator [Pedobacter changchengzhani]